MIMRMYLKWGEAKSFNTEVIEVSPGEVAGIKSATIKFEGNYAYAVIILSTIYYLIGLVADLKDLAPHTKLSLIVISTFIVI